MNVNNIFTKDPDEKNSTIGSRVAGHYDKIAQSSSSRLSLKHGYYSELYTLLNNLVLPGQRILDVGCGNGHLLKRLQPSYGVGIDISSQMIETARKRHRDLSSLHFHVCDACDEAGLRNLGEKFDIILAVGVIQEMEDVFRFLRGLRCCCTSLTRLIIVSFSRLWQWPLRVAETLRLKTAQPVENWIAPEIIGELLYASDFQQIRNVKHLLFPFPVPFVSRFINKYIGHLPLIDAFSMLYCIVASPVRCLDNSGRPKSPTCTVVIPCRNEAGHIHQLARRLPDLPKGSEIIWVEGHSTDNTTEVIQRVIADYPNKPFRFLKQPGIGKADAVRTAFEAAKGDIVLILDADITVAPEDIPKFVCLLAEDKAEFINGTRQVYPMEERAMAFLNLLGNKCFAFIFRRLLGQFVSDTLCGTKAMWRSDYQRLALNRSFFGTFDPFGDFDLLFGAARMHLKIFDLPIRYGERTYGRTNISRFSHGLLLVKMCIFAARKMYFI